MWYLHAKGFKMGKTFLKNKKKKTFKNPINNLLRKIYGEKQCGGISVVGWLSKHA